MQKIKNLVHSNRDANHNGIPDSQERLGTAPLASTTDRNHNGIPDSQERVGGIQKIKNLLHRQHEAPVAPVGPMTGPAVVPAPALTGEQFLTTKNTLSHVDGPLADRNMNGIPDSMERNQLGGLNDRNLNGIPDNLEPRMASFRSEPVQVQLVEKDVVVHEHIHPLEKEEIQPVIYREREQLDIKQITQQLHETQIHPTIIQRREAAPEVRAPIVERAVIEENIVLPTTRLDTTLRSVEVKAPIVNEVVKKTVIEEIQPVLERDIIQSVLIQETKPIYEKVVEAPVVFRETTVVQDRGINGGSLEALRAQGFNLGTYGGLPNDRNMNGIPDNLEGGNQFGGLNNDRNMNGIPDNLEGGSLPSTSAIDAKRSLHQELLSNDRNLNGIPDNLEGRNRFGGLSNDRNMNGIPDNLEGGNQLRGLNNDRNLNGIPDNLEAKRSLHQELLATTNRAASPQVAPLRAH